MQKKGTGNHYENTTGECMATKQISLYFSTVGASITRSRFWYSSDLVVS